MPLDYRATCCFDPRICQKSQKNLINLTNGVFNIADGTIRASRKEDYFTSKINARYLKKVPENGAPVFKKFCESVFNKEYIVQKTALLEEIIGYSLSNLIEAKTSIIMVGPSGSGKSVLLRVITELLGQENVSTLSLSNFADRFSKAELLNKKANICGEIPVDPVPSKALDLWKGVIGNDLIFAERKGQDPFSFQPYCKLLFAGNVMPSFSGVDGSDSIMERITLIVFDKTVEKRKRDPDMDKHLLQERDVIVTNALNRLRLLCKNKYEFQMGEDEFRVLDEYREQINSVATFIQQECEYDKESYVYISELYDRYNEFVTDAAIQAEKRSSFRAKVLLDPNVTKAGKKRLNGQPPKACFQGLKLK